VQRTAAAAKPTSIGGAAARRAAAQDRREPPPAGWATPDDAGGSPPGPVEVVSTAVKAVGEVAQIGMAVGGQAVKSVLSKLPKP
jgi:hypothetical protein